MNNDGSFTTGMYEKEFTTEAVAPSNNVISCEVVKTYADGCDVKVTTTNDDPYMIDAQPSFLQLMATRHLLQSRFCQAHTAAMQTTLQRRAIRSIRYK